MFIGLNISNHIIGIFNSSIKYDAININKIMFWFINIYFSFNIFSHSPKLTDDILLYILLLWLYDADVVN